MKCNEFRASAPLGVETHAMLQHLRECVDCMNFAATIDPMNLFRSIGGEEDEVPGGTEAFVADVMDEIRRNERMKPARFEHRVAPIYRWSVAAAIALCAASFALMYRPMSVAPVATQVAAVRPAPASQITRPVVEEYDNGAAMIVEVPMQPTDDVQVVMIFDEALPADL